MLLFLATAALILSSCSAKNGSLVQTLESSNEVSDDKIQEKNPYQDKIKDLPNEDFGGAAFRIATDSSSLFLNANHASVVGKNQYLRNKAVEEKYNVTLTLTDESGLPTIAERVRTEALAGNDFCDLVVLRSSSFSLLASANLLHNVRTVPYLELDNENIYQSSLTGATFGGITYGFASDFILEDENMFSVFFNREMLEKTNLPDLYDLVAQNQWDFENFLLYAEEVYSLEASTGNRITGFCSTETRESLLNVFWAASGNSFFSNEYGKRPELIYDNEDTERFITMIQSILFQTPIYSPDEQTADLKFKNGTAFFLIAPLSYAESFTSCGVNWGVVPLPKLDINQREFHSYVKSTPLYAGFTIGTSNLKMSGLISTALVQSSSSLWQELAIMSHLNLYAFSSRDAEMLRSILKSPYYDAAEFLSVFDDSISASTQTLLYRAASQEGRFDSLYEQYNKMLKKYLDEKF